VLCAKCKTENPEGLKFCNECGAPFKTPCASCGFENAPAAKFCGQCGATLGAPPATVSGKKSDQTQIRLTEAAAPENLEGERKTVTMLFADIKGSMDLMEDLDPEEARAIVDPALKLMMEAVHHYGGYVAQPTGDGIFALFGAPIAHEDHPQRALFAAVRLQEEMRRYSAKLRLAGNLPVEARVGVNTGEVVVRSITTGEGRTEYAPVGHSTGIAARMQSVAPVGSIAATEQVRKLCEGYFVFKSLGPTKVKGVSEPVNVYEVTGPGALRSHFELSARRGLTRFVGRGRELDQLRRALELALGGQGQVVAVMAEAGTGKSRLFYEFKATLPATCKVLEAYSVSHGKASAWLPMLELLRGYFDIQDTDDPGMRRKKVRAALSALDPSLDDALPYLFGLLGIVEDPDPLAQMELQIKRQRTFDALKRMVLRQSLRQPIVVIFEDLHWIDDQTQALLNLLVDSLANVRILLLVNYRPEYHHGWTNKSYYLQLRLDPLGGADGDAMLLALLGESVELNPVKRLIAERTGGNPFFIEEIVQTLFDEGALVRNGAVKVTRSLSQLKLPPTVQGMLAARIDRLSSSQKDLLQTLAVLGRESSLGLLKQVASHSDTQLGLTLAQLLASEFIYEQPGAGDVEYVFKHALTQEVAYNSLLIDRRKVLHERAGQALESMFAEQLDDHLDDLAHHYSRSDKVAKAAHYLGLAGIRALDSSAHTEAKALLSASLERLRTLPASPDRDRTELTAQISVGELTIALKGYADPEVERAYGRAAELCGRLPDSPYLLKARALSGLSANYQFRSRYRKCLEIGKELLALSRDTDSPSGLPTAYLCFATASFWLGDLKVAREYFEKILAMSRIPRTAVHVRVGIQCVTPSYLAWTLWYTGYPDQGLAAARRALAIAKKLNHAWSLAQSLSFAARFHVLRREPAIALELANELLEYSERNNFPTWIGESTLVRGWAIAQLGREEEGIAAMRAGLAIRDAAQENDARPQYQAWLAEALGRVGRVQEGLDLLASYFDKEHEVPVYEPEVHLLRASLYLEQDPPDLLQAKRSTQAAIEIAHGFGAKSFELRATISFARLLSSQGKRDEARAMLAEIYNWFTEGFDTADLKDAKALLSELST